MASAARKKGLGKGLGALIGSSGLNEKEATGAGTVKAAALSDGAVLIELDPTTIKPNPKQPRRQFDEEALDELAASIKKDGVLEPVIVRKTGDDYELVSGERRVRASIIADFQLVPAICRTYSDSDMLKLGLIENLQREDLNAIETAHAYEELIQEFKWTQEQLADEVGKKRATVTNTLRLLKLPEPVQAMVAEAQMSMGHARALLGIDNPNTIHTLARKVLNKGLSVRQTEQMVSAHKEGLGKKKTTKADPVKDPNIVKLEDDLRRALGTRVALKSQSQGKGKIEIDYYSLDELERLLAILNPGS